MRISLDKTINPLLQRVIVFLCIFVIISGSLGPRIISGHILNHDGFGIYGGLGKAIIFGLIAFVMLSRHSTVKVTLKPWKSSLLGWIGGAILLCGLAWIGVANLIDNERTIQNMMLAHGGLLGSLACAAIGCFGAKNLQILWKSYRREFTYSIIFAALFYLFLLAVYALWQPLASVVLQSVKGLLEMSGLQVVVLQPHTLLFDKFGITVAEYCSGIESIALFTSLYAIVGLLDWNRLNKTRYFVIFPFALCLLSILNIFRVYGLIMAGYYINPHIAFSLFHTYAGMIFFILYSIVFWSIAYNYLTTNQNIHPQDISS